MDLSYINFGGNRFTGEIPTTICKATSLEILDLSNNELSGELLPCLGNLANKLLSLNLGDNKLRGPIPITFTESCALEVLNMYNNHFEGPLPQVLANCEKLKILNFGNNKISGTFPAWLMSLQELEVLILRSNRLHGTVSGRSVSHPFPMLRIVDLSNNEFNGDLPIPYFNNIKPNDQPFGYVAVVRVYYTASVSLVVKGKEYEVNKILHIYTTIDLSCNKFRGEIPMYTGEF